jgi:hypothetical protein
MRSDLECRSCDDIGSFHRLHVATAIRKGFRPIGINSLRRQWEILAPQKRCHIIEVRQAGVPIAGEWLTSFGGTVTSGLRGLQLCTTNPLATRHAGTASLWAAIRWARSAGARFFDFGGFDYKAAEAVVSGNPLPEDMAAESRIKRSFGGEAVLLPRPHFVFTNPLAQQALGSVSAGLLSSQAVRRLAQRFRPKF